MACAWLLTSLPVDGWVCRGQAALGRRGASRFASQEMNQVRQRGSEYQVLRVRQGCFLPIGLGHNQLAALLLSQIRQAEHAVDSLKGSA